MNARDFINLLVAGAENLDWVEIAGPAWLRAFGGRLIIIRCLGYDYEQARRTCYGWWGFNEDKSQGNNFLILFCHHLLLSLLLRDDFVL